MSLLLLLFAEGEAATPGQPENPLRMLIPMALIFLAFYLFILRPMKNKEADKQAQLLKGLKKNDRIVTIGGIYGTVISVAEKEDEVVIKVDDNTRLKMLKSSIGRNITNEEAAKAPKDESKK